MSFPTLPLPGALAGAYNVRRTGWQHRAWQLLRGALNQARRTVLGLLALKPLALARRVAAENPPLVLNAYSARAWHRRHPIDARQRVTGYWVVRHCRRNGSPRPHSRHFRVAGCRRCILVSQLVAGPATLLRSRACLWARLAAAGRIVSRLG
ncbi:MAG: hypothetical protein U0074_08890 [Kouleothrix sp.]